MTQNKTFFGACTLMKGIVDTVGYGGSANFIYIFSFGYIYCLSTLFIYKISDIFIKSTVSTVSR